MRQREQMETLNNNLDRLMGVLVALLNYGQVMGSMAKTALSRVTDRRD